MKCSALDENQLYLREFRYRVYMLNKIFFQNIVNKWGFRPVEKRVHARVNEHFIF